MVVKGKRRAMERERGWLPLTISRKNERKIAVAEALNIHNVLLME